MPEPAFTLPGIRVHLPRNRCSRSPEYVFTMLWNGCSPSAGICVHDAPEYAIGPVTLPSSRWSSNAPSPWPPPLDSTERRCRNSSAPPPPLGFPKTAKLNNVSLRKFIADIEKRIIVQTLERVDGSQKRTAEKLRLNPTTLHEKMKRHKILL